MNCNIDIAVAWFPCPPSSVLNPVRWQPNYDPMQEKGTEVFYEIVEWLRWYGQLGIIVKLVILENVLGIFMRTRYNNKPHWYYFKKELKTVQTHVLLNVEKMTCHAVDFAVNAPIDYDRILKVQEPFRHGPWMLQVRSPLPPPRHLHHRDVFCK